MDIDIKLKRWRIKAFKPLWWLCMTVTMLGFTACTLGSLVAFSCIAYALWG